MELQLPLRATFGVYNGNIYYSTHKSAEPLALYTVNMGHLSLHLNQHTINTLIPLMKTNS